MSDLDLDLALPLTFRQNCIKMIHSTRLHSVFRAATKIVVSLPVMQRIYLRATIAKKAIKHRLRT